jgi:hypothetical protein
MVRLRSVGIPIVCGMVAAVVPSIAAAGLERS